MTSPEKIYDFIQKNAPTSVNDLLDLGLSRQMIHRHLKKLLESGKIIKKGSPPKVFYFPKKEIEIHTDYAKVDPKIQKYIDDNFLYFLPDGKILPGFQGFFAWALSHKQNIEKAAEEYQIVQKKYQAYQNKKGLIDGTEKMKNTFSKMYLEGCFYFDFYSIERFGKTKLGSLLLHAKQAQNIPLMEKIIKLTHQKFFDFLKWKKIDAVAFLPHSIDRKIQLLEVIEKKFKIPLPSIKLFKITEEIPIAQKSLSKIEERIENARETIFIKPPAFPITYQNLLLIDDAVGSGATLNEVAQKIKDKKIAKNVWGLAFVGSFKGFDVISEI